MKNLAVIYFAGYGGVSIGAVAEGYQTIGVEWEEAIATVYKQNIGDCIVADVADFNPVTLNLLSPEERKQLGIHLVWQLSPPCQEYSKLNQSKNPNSVRATILRNTFTHLDILQPEYIWLENVAGYYKAEVYQEFCMLLKAKGYTVVDYRVNATDFGLPQSRGRLVMLAAKEGYKLPVIKVTSCKQTWDSSIADLIPTLTKSELTPAQLKGISDDVTYPYLIQRTGYYNKKPKIATVSQSIWTIKATLGTDQKGSRRKKYIDLVLSPTDVRSLDVKCLSRLQGFPDWYQLSGDSALDIKGIGNSVPPSMSQAVFKAIKESYEKSK
jgi:DNA (cytosine-5)-methyltransferase 1